MTLEQWVAFWDGAFFWLALAAAILGALGYGAGFVSRHYNRQLAAEKVVSQREKDRQTNLAIENARREAAEANARAAEANLELAKIRAPRRLIAEQSEHVATAIKSFAGVHFTASVFNNQESIDLLTQIENTLASAGWVQKHAADLAMFHLHVRATRTSG